jgi:hypothetical protein
MDYRPNLMDRRYITSITVYAENAPVSNTSALNWVPEPQRENRLVTPSYVQTTSRTTAICLVKVEPPWAYELSERAKKIKQLKNGWDGPKSIPVDKSLIAEAETLVSSVLMSVRRPSAPYLAPGGNGTVQIEWHTKLGEIELELSPEGTASIWVRNRLSKEEFEGEDETAFALFSRWAPWVAKAIDDENDVPVAASTSLYGSEAKLPFYKDDTIT